MADCKNLELARQWAADIDADRQALSQDTIDAAADLINGLPDAWVSVDELRKYISDWRAGLAKAPRGNYEGEMLDGLEDMLPAPPAPRTMADIEWDDENHVGLLARRENDELVRMVAVDVEDSRYIICINLDGNAVYLRNSSLSPVSGTQLNLAPDEAEPEDDVAAATGGELTTQDVVDECRAVRKERAAAESASPRPESVPVGEAWQVEVDGQAAIGYRNAPEGKICWTAAYRDTADHDWLYDSDVTLIARLVPETTEQDDEQVLDPAYTYRDKDGDTWEFLNCNWRCTDYGRDATNYLTPPAKYGPYTRIEDTNE